MYLTADMLREKNACHRQVAVFEKEWPDGVKITKKAIIRAVVLGLDIDWFADNFLSAPIRKAYWKAMASVREAYNEVTAPVQKVFLIVPAEEAYEEAEASIWRAYRKVGWEAYEKALTSALKAYREATSPIWKAYEEVKASALHICFAEE